MDGQDLRTNPSVRPVRRGVIAEDERARPSPGSAMQTTSSRGTVASTTPHSRQARRSRARLVHPDVVAMAIAALRVVAQQQIRVILRQQGGQLGRRFPEVSPREARPARRVLIQPRSVPAVGVAEVHGPVSAEDRGARRQLFKPPALVRAISHVAVTGHDDDHPMVLRRQSRDRSARTPPAAREHARNTAAISTAGHRLT
jgi:hypothetical protein